MPAIVADSFGGIQAALAQQQQMRQQALQASLAQLYQTSQAVQQHKLALQDLAMRQQQLQMQAQDMDAQRQYRLAQAQHDAVNDQLNQQQFQLNKQVTERNLAAPTPEQDRNAQWEFSQANADADSGRFGSPDDISKQYPTISSPHAHALAARSMASRAYQLENVENASRAAKIIDADAQDPYGTQIAQIQKGVSRIPFIGGPTADQATQIQDLQRRKAALSQAAAVIKQNPRAYNIALDPDSGRYVPTVSKPAWMTDSSGGPTAPAGSEQDDMGAGDDTSADAPAPSRSMVGTTAGTGTSVTPPTPSAPAKTATATAGNGTVHQFRDVHGNTAPVAQSNWAIALSRGAVDLDAQSSAPGYLAPNVASDMAGRGYLH